VITTCEIRQAGNRQINKIISVFFMEIVI